MAKGIPKLYTWIYQMIKLIFVTKWHVVFNENSGNQTAIGLRRAT